MRLLPEISKRFLYKDDYSYWVFERKPDLGWKFFL